MRAKTKAVIGQRYGRLICIGQAPFVERARVIVQCDCGSAPKIVSESDLVRRPAKLSSCGCFKREFVADKNRTHGMSDKRVYRSWSSMVQRATNPKNKQWPDYGGRGIDIDPRWQVSFEAFYADMGEPPTRKHSIERQDNSRGYWPDNCVWATAHEQGANTRANITVVLHDRPMIVAEAARRLGVSYSGVWLRVARRGETHQQAIDHFLGRRP